MRGQGHSRIDVRIDHLRIIKPSLAIAQPLGQFDQFKIADTRRKGHPKIHSILLFEHNAACISG